jgi:hypothetical protein
MTIIIEINIVYFIYSLFSDAASSTDYVYREMAWLVNNDFEKMCKERSQGNLKYYPDIYLERLRKFTKTLSLDSRSRDLDLNPGSAEFGKKKA